MKIKFLVIVLFILLSISSCDSFLSLKIVNESNHDILFDFAVNSSGSTVYPDTTLQGFSGRLLQNCASRNSAGSDFRYPAFRSHGEIFDLVPSDTISLYIFHPDTLSKYGWETVIKDYKVLVRYDLSRQDFARLNWTAYYPGILQMEGIRQYRPKN